MALRTFLATLLISSSFLVGCALLEPAPNTDAPSGPVTKVILGDYDEIWRAVQKALVNYPIQMNNSDQGIIETDVIKADQAWRAPHEKKAPKRNLRYILRVQVIRGAVKKQTSSKVVVTKIASMEKDFFSGEERLPTDGLEESALIYRIERELTLERSLRKAFERGR